MIKILSDNNFEDYINNVKQILLIDCHATWCMPCKRIAPILEELAINPQITIGKIDIEKNPIICNQLGIKGVPTLILYKDKKQLDMKVGFHNKEQIISWINYYDPKI